jgi:uncharacterized protein
MRATLPKRFSVTKLAFGGISLAGDVPLERMPRVARCCADVLGEEELRSHTVQISLTARSGPETSTYLSGTIVGCLPLECQRCLTRVDVSLDVSISVSVVPDEAAEAQLPAGEEGLVSKDGVVELYPLIEEEILLALPVAPSHAEHECAVPAIAGPSPARDGALALEQGARSGANNTGDLTDAPQSPFAGLAQLLEQS